MAQMLAFLPEHAAFILVGGSVIGFLLGLLGGGGSLLAVPMLLHVGGMVSAHLAIGTSAVAVALNALLNAWGHARRGNVAVRPAIIFSALGMLMSVLGAWVGLGTPGKMLMLAFGCLTFMVGVWTAWRGQGDGKSVVACESGVCPRVALAGAVVGGMAGFFGIGGGFMAVPALLWATGLPMPQVIGTGLVGVGMLGLGTAAMYAWAGQVVWPVAALLLVGGFFGGRLGAWVGQFVHARWKNLLRFAFALLVSGVGLSLIVRYAFGG